MYPSRIILKNFGPFERVDYRFSKEPIAIVGENKTQDDQLSNGSGKSFLEQGLFYGIYGANLRDRQDKKLIRKGFDTAYICVFIYCPIRKQTLRIEREIRTKGSSVLVLSILTDDENVQPVSFATVADGNKYVVNWIEISAEDAKSYYIVSKGNYNSFFRSSNTDKLALISRFINFSSIDKTKNIIEGEISRLNGEKQALECEKASFEGKLSAYQEQLQDILDHDPEEDRMKEIENTKEYILETKRQNDSYREDQKMYKLNLISLQKEIDEFKKTEDELSKELSQTDTSEFDVIYKEIDRELEECNNNKKIKQNELTKVQKRAQQIQNTLQRLETILAGVIICPNCNHEFFIDNEKDPKQVLEEKSSREKELQAEQKKMESVNTFLSSFDEMIREYDLLKRQTDEEFSQVMSEKQSLRKKIESVENRIHTIKRQYASLTSKIEDLENRIENNKKIIEHKEALIDQLKKAKVTERETGKYEQAIEECEKFIKAQDKKILDKSNEIFKVQQWIQRFKDFKMHLAMEQLKNIQIKANEILKLMGSDLRLMIEGFKTDAKGKVKEEITPYVFRDEMESFFYYSGGEQAKCEIALILALQQMINATKKYGGMQFLLIDEVLESADSLGIEKIIVSLGFLNQSSLIITHVPKINEEINQVRVIKENGISRLEV